MSKSEGQLSVYNTGEQIVLYIIAVSYSCPMTNLISGLIQHDCFQKHGAKVELFQITSFQLWMLK